MALITSSNRMGKEPAQKTRWVITEYNRFKNLNAMEETGKTRKAKQNVFQNLVRYQIFLVIGVKMELKLGG